MPFDLDKWNDTRRFDPTGNCCRVFVSYTPLSNHIASSPTMFSSVTLLVQSYRVITNTWSLILCFYFGGQVMMSRLGAQRIGMEGMEKEVTARVRTSFFVSVLVEKNFCC